MGVFKSLTRQLFVQKRHYANLVLLIEAFAIIFVFFTSVITDPKGTQQSISNFFMGIGQDWPELLVGSVILFSIFADMIFCGLLCWQNERVNSSQSWQLVPASTNQVWLINLFSSLLACAYIFIIQLVVGFFSAIPFEIDRHRNLWLDLKKVIGIGNNDFWTTLQTLEFLVAMVLLIFTMVTFVNYSSKTISEVLPNGNTNWIKLLVFAIVAVICVYLCLSINHHLTNYYIQNTYLVRKNGGEFIYENPMWLENLEFIAGIIVFGGLDLWLGHKYWEPRKDR
ncbi:MULTISPECIES: ABC transporter permease [Lactobacillus]|uniref:ABC transporter permease n=1 Tax=Lactobacillus xujianguonis TaxID=2495899 RepID=A0A437SXS1_9LACO|nr:MULTISPECIES: ABC transporter permease [Lactobacillus]RVU71715.1 ABC transporter permease [Lactobacillus xujianguonis]RVU77545.1 ABC transporter permease [Lactobacillus xujianguonis]